MKGVIAKTTGMSDDAEGFGHGSVLGLGPYDWTIP